MEPSTEAKLTVYFDEPFWVGVFEELDGKDLSVCRVVFGAEPTDAEIYAFILKYFNHLRFSPPVRTEIKHKADNPKRRQRNAHKQLEKTGVFILPFTLTIINIRYTAVFVCAVATVAAIMESRTVIIGEY